MTNLYNKPPAWLQQAHQRLDAAVFAAYGWPTDLTDNDILTRLLDLNLQRPAQGQAAAGEAEDEEMSEAEGDGV